MLLIKRILWLKILLSTWWCFTQILSGYYLHKGMSDPCSRGSLFKLLLASVYSVSLFSDVAWCNGVSYHHWSATANFVFSVKVLSIHIFDEYFVEACFSDFFAQWTILFFIYSHVQFAQLKLQLRSFSKKIDQSETYRDSARENCLFKISVFFSIIL